MKKAIRVLLRIILFPCSLLIWVVLMLTGLFFLLSDYLYNKDLCVAKETMKDITRAFITSTFD